MVKKSPPDEALQEWETFLRHVKPLKAKAKIMHTPKESKTTPQPHHFSIPQDFAQALDPFITGPAQKRPRKTRHPERVLDLHGYTENAAWSALESAVQKCTKQRIQRLLVVTGKGAQGEGVLRRAVPRWLKETELASAIKSMTQAPEEWGGAGAWVVHIRTIE